jgi:hypothetical protein
MGEVLVDVEAARAALERLGAEAQAAEFQREQKFERGQAAMETAQSEPESWLPVARQSVDFCAHQVCPAWELTDDERAQVAAGVAEVLDHYFPGALHGFAAWHPLAKLCGTLFFVALSRFDFDRGEFKPLQHRKANNGTRETEGWRADPDHGQEPERQNHGHAQIGTG